MHPEGLMYDIDILNLGNSRQEDPSESLAQHSRLLWLQRCDPAMPQC